MKKRIRGIYLTFLILIPTIVSAKTTDLSQLPIVLLAEAFCTIHMCAFVLFPVSKLLAKENEDKKLFWILFSIRVAIIVIGDFITPWTIFMIDFFSIFIGAFILVPILTLIKKKGSFTGINSSKATSNLAHAQSAAAVTALSQKQVNTKFKCSKCGKESALGNKFCPICGTTLTENDYIEKDENIQSTDASSGKPFNKEDYDAYLFGNIDFSLKGIIKENLKKNPESENATLPIIEKKKNIITCFFTVTLTILLIIFFVYHLNWIVLVSLIGIILYFIVIKSYNLEKYLVKEIKSRPSEKIDYIISSILSGKVVDNRKNKLLRIGIISLALLLQLFLFEKPHLIYERTDNGYAIRYYTIGIFKRDKELVIPKEYKGKPVVSIRGSVFARINSLEKVTLPETIQEIRGEAFMECSNLKSINIPIGVTEIKGSTFEGCSDLTKVEIPEGVTRIGGSAFRECKNLTNVTIPKTVTEIGSSAFRGTRISNVCVSKNTYINERAFKETFATISYYELGCNNPNASGYGYGYRNDNDYENENGNNYEEGYEYVDKYEK